MQGFLKMWGRATGLLVSDRWTNKQTHDDGKYHASIVSRW